MTTLPPAPRAIRWTVAALSLALVAATFVPYAAQWADGSDGKAFTGLLVRVPDGCSYLSWMDQHAAGDVRVRNRMALDAPGAILPNPAWWLLGGVAGLTGLPPVAVYHGGRAAFAIAWLWVLWALCRRATGGRDRTALAAFGMAAAGSGLLWVRALGLDVETADWIPELWTWPSILLYPHFALSLALAGGGVVLWWRGRDGGGARDLAGAAAAFGLLAFVHPYTALAMFAAVAVHGGITLLRGGAGGPAPQGPADAGRGPADGPGAGKGLLAPGRLRAHLVLLLALGAGLAILGAQVLWSPAMRAWAAENVMPSPPPHHYLLGLGIPGLLALAGIARLALARAWDDRRLFLLAWVGAAFALAYASPLVKVERRCVEGVHVAVCLLAAEALSPWLESRSRATAAAFLAALVILVAPTNAGVAWREATSRVPGRVHGDWPALFEAVRGLPEPRTVLADARTGMFLAGFAGAAVFAGHDQLTPDLQQKMASWKAFSEEPAPWSHRAAFLRQVGARWLVTDPRKPPPGADGQDGLPPGPPVAAGRTWAIWGPVE